MKNTTLFKRIFKANGDLFKRIEDNSISYSYLDDEDVLLITLKESKSFLSVTTPDGFIVIHFNPKTYKIVGFTVPYVQEFLDYFSSLHEKIDNKEGSVETVKKKKTPGSLVRPVATSGMNGLAFAF
jgi:hypothetical protein